MADYNTTQLISQSDFVTLASGATARRLGATLSLCSPSNKAMAFDTPKQTALQTGTGSEQSITIALAATPTFVLAIPQGAFNGITGDISYGTHTSTALKVTAPTGLKYIVLYF